ncbi:hypothetical protein EIP86_009950 [Pleurotus ostreatoroseus]|nr:hypothetical protein EIP86_009950 [Pleurotus ostreatoroseus]
MSTLKHNIRQQQAQLHNLENALLRGPRPLPPGIFNSPAFTLEELEYSPYDSSTLYTPSATSGASSPSPSTAVKSLRRTSFEALQNLAGSDSNLPLPRRDHRSASFGDDGSVGEIREGIPLSSPRNTTKVLADLQAGVLNARNALENTKAQLRQSQRQVSQLTRQTEDLKEVRERLRLENEGLNNVVTRKERLLQEVLERARKAESEVVALKAQLKSETTTSKKSMREMETALAESTARSQKSEREYITLRESLKGLVQSFKTDHERLREEMRKREERMRKEAEEVAKKYRRLAEEVKKQREVDGGGLGEAVKLKEESERIRNEMETRIEAKVEVLREEVGKATKHNEDAVNTAKNLSDELARMRRLMRMSGSAANSSSAPSIPVPDSYPGAQTLP